MSELTRDDLLLHLAKAERDANTANSREDVSDMDYGMLVSTRNDLAYQIVRQCMAEDLNRARAALAKMPPSAASSAARIPSKW